MADPQSMREEAKDKRAQAAALESEAHDLESDARATEAAMLAEAADLDRQASTESMRDNHAEAADLSRQADDTRRQARGGSVW